MTVIQESWKAVAALVLTALATFLTSTGGGVSVGEAARSAALGLITGALVWLVPNQKPTTATPGFIQGEAGQGVIGLILTIVGVICLVVGGFDLIASLLQNRPPALLRDILLIIIGLILIGTRYYDFDSRGGRGVVR